MSILTPQPPVSFFVRLRDQPRTATAWVRDGSSFPWAVNVVKYKLLTFPMHHQVRWCCAPEGRHENPGQTWWWLTVIHIFTAAGERVQRCEEISFAILLLLCFNGILAIITWTSSLSRSALTFTIKRFPEIIIGGIIIILLWLHRYTINRQ